LQAFFLDVSPQITDRNIIFGKAWEGRNNLATVASGKVKSFRFENQYYCSFYKFSFIFIPRAGQNQDFSNPSIL